MTIAIEKVLAEQEEIISVQAYKALQKIKKPTILELEDLQQEGQMAAIKAIQSFDPSKDATLDTWIYFIVTRRFYDIVWESYRKIDQVNFEDFSVTYM